jgi:hypothetical protein
LLSRLGQRALPGPRDQSYSYATSVPDGVSGHLVCRTLAISCEAVTPPVCPAGAQGGTLYARPGAALSFVSCIALFCGTHSSLWVVYVGDSGFVNRRFQDSCARRADRHAMHPALHPELIRHLTNPAPISTRPASTIAPTVYASKGATLAVTLRPGAARWARQLANHTPCPRPHSADRRAAPPMGPDVYGCAMNQAALTPTTTAPRPATTIGSGGRKSEW